VVTRHLASGLPVLADPAFLLEAWRRVRTNKGARTAGIDGWTAPGIEASEHGVLGFLSQIRADLKARTFVPLPVAERMIPKSSGKMRRLGKFVRGPRGDSPENQLMVQFQGMFAEYEKAQLMERYRRGKTYRARSGSVNVLGGAPFGYRHLRKTPECGATYEIVESEAALVVELFRRYTDDGASIADLTRWLSAGGTPTRSGQTRWDRSVVWGMLRNPAYAGQAAFGKTRILHESPGLNRRARLEGRGRVRCPGPL
jgi:hypothetical protein